MKITNHSVGNASLTPNHQVQANQAAAEPTAEIAPAASKGYTPSPELQRLLDLAHLQPDVRADRVREVAERLSRGDYLSPATDERTAEAMMRGFDS